MSEKRKDSKGRVLKDGESQRANGTYDYRYTDIHKKRRCIYAKSLTELRKKEEELWRDLADGIDYAAGEMTVADLVDRYMNLKRGLKPNSLRSYNTAVKRIHADPFGQKAIKTVKLSDAKGWFVFLHDSGFKQNTIGILQSVVRPAFEMAEFRKILGPNAYDVDVPGLEYTVVHLLQQKGLHAATAESCTGGLVAEKITNVPGSSEVFGYGFVTYAEAAKAKLLGVDPTLIKQYNVVSGPVAVAMAYGALQASGADLAVGITGIAGPGGALPGKPVGTVYLAGADARSGKAWLMRLELGGYAERSIIRTRAALYALDLLRRMALDIPPENAHPVPSKDVKPETLDI